VPSLAVTSTWCSAAAKVESRSSSTLMPPNSTKEAELDNDTVSLMATLTASVTTVTSGFRDGGNGGRADARDCSRLQVDAGAGIIHFHGPYPERHWPGRAPGY